MSRERKYREKPEPPKALVCGMLEDEGRVLFLTFKDSHGIERLELPCVYARQQSDPVSQLGEAFLKQAGIDGEVGEIVLESRHNAGSRRRRRWIPCYVFGIKAKTRKADPGGGYTGFRWLSLKDAKKEKLGRKAEWLLKIGQR